MSSQHATGNTSLAIFNWPVQIVKDFKKGEALTKSIAKDKGVRGKGIREEGGGGLLEMYSRV